MWIWYTMVESRLSSWFWSSWRFLSLFFSLFLSLFFIIDFIIIFLIVIFFLFNNAHLFIISLYIIVLWFLQSHRCLTNRLTFYNNINTIITDEEALKREKEWIKQFQKQKQQTRVDWDNYEKEVLANPPNIFFSFFSSLSFYQYFYTFILFVSFFCLIFYFMPYYLLFYWLYSYLYY